MKNSKKKIPGNQIEMPFVAPTMMIPAVRILQPNGGVLIMPGKPVMVGDEIGTVEAARILGLKPRQVQRLFEDENFQTAFKPGGTSGSNWRVSRAEVLDRKSWRNI